MLAALVAAAPIPAQYVSFGQNKIQYRDFDWHVLSGRHVDVYYYPAEERIARLALAAAEDSYDALSTRFLHEIRRRIPLIVYASHTDWEQTNVIPFVPPEGVLGVTEFMKRRVTLPFRGSYAEFRHTLRHEMVHVFHLSLLTEQFELYPRARRAYVPLWWSEGLAEYWSSPQDARDEMVVRDLTLHGRLPTIAQLGYTHSPIVYPLGGELHRFLAGRYGEWRIRAVYGSLSKYAGFEEVVRAVYGRSVAQLTEEWHYALRQRFFPEVAGRRPLTVAGRPIADLAVKPVAYRRPRSGAVDVAYLSPRTGYTNIYRTPLDGRAPEQVLVAGERTPEFESLHPFSSRLDVRDGVLLFASKFGDRDALFFWDIRRSRVVGRYHFDSLVAILSPAWSHDGRRVAFSGLSADGLSDLYVFEMARDSLVRVTDDVYEDLDPVWLPGDGSLAFSSDRGVGGEEGSRNLYRLDLASRRAEPITSGRWVDETPRWDAESGRLVFASDRDGTLNVYSVDTLGEGRRETSLDGGAFDPSPVPGDDRLVVSAFGRGTWRVYALAPDSVPAAVFALRPDSTSWHWRELADPRIASATSRKYRRDYSLDLATGGGDIAPGYGAVEGAQIYFSDLLGDHAIATSISLYQTGSASDLLTNLNANVFYLNQRRRLNWGLGAFRLAGTFRELDFQTVYTERSTGAYAAVRYPFSRFTRIEAQTRIEYSHRNDFASVIVRGDPERRGALVSNFLSLVGDNALWLATGPIDGMRWNLSGGVVSDVTHGVFENWIGITDVRKYVRTTGQSAFALRALGYVSEGTRPRAITIGGTWLLRGYPRFYVDGTRAWLANAEWRFPLANFVAFGFPFGTIRFPELQAAVFNDLAQAWYREQYDRRILGSYGLGIRMPLVPGLVLRADFARRYALDNRSRLENPYGERGVFDFFIGYNY